MATLIRSAKLTKLVPIVARVASRSTVRTARVRCHLERLSTCSPSSFNISSPRLLSVSAARWQQSSSQAATDSDQVAQNIKSDNEFRMVLRRLDDMVRRTGRITKTQLLLVLDEVCKLGAATPNQALLLIRSCGSLLPEVNFEDRTALVTTIWDKLQQLGTTYDASHYNALLKVYLQNEHKFSPTDFLANMESNGIEANRVTYQRLISAYCLQGDIQGATEILEFMKSKDLPVTEGVFNSLITGHGRAGDLENAKNILNVMRTVGLEASSDTYTALMCAYAEKGDIDSILQLVEELESLSQTISGRYFLSVAYSLATSGYSEHLPRILEKVQLSAGYIPDTINLALSLMTREQHAAAFEIVKMFEAIKPEASVDGEQQNQGNFFIDHAVQMQMPHDTLFGYLDQLMSSGLHSSPYVIALHSALRKAKENGDYAVGIMKKMMELGMPVRPHYFWPLMARDTLAGNKEGIYQLWKTMHDMGVEVSTDTYSKYIFPALGDSLEEIRGLLNRLGVSVDKSLVIAICRNEVKHQRIDNVVQLINEYKELADVALMKAGLVSCFNKNPQVEPMVHICRHLVDSFEDIEDSNITKQDYLGSFLYDIISQIPESRAQMLKPHLQLLMSKLASEGLHISGQRFRGIRTVLDRIKLPMLKPVAMKLTDPNEIQNNRVANLDLLAEESISVDELETHLQELREKGGNKRGILRRLILIYANSNNYQKTIELKKEFDDAGYEMTGGIYACLINMCCNMGKFSEALQLKEQLSQFDPTFKLDVAKYRFLICSLVKDNKLPEALDLVQELKDLAVESDRMEKHVFHTLNDLAGLGLCEEVERLFDVMVELDIVKPNNNLLGPLVTAHFQKNDMEGALACIRDCQAKYGIMPHFHDVLIRLVEQGDTNQLQKAMDFTSQQHGDINMLYDLIFAFLTTGKYQEAQKLFETPGMIAKDRRLQWYAEKCIGSNMADQLEQLIAMTKDLYACDRDNMHFYLIQLHARNKDVDKCLQVWTMMQDEGVVPRDRTLRYLANVLRTFERPVPFEVPKLTEEQLETESQAVGSVDMIERMARAGNVEGAKLLLKKCRSEGKDIALRTVETLIYETLKLGNIEEALAVKKEGEQIEGFKFHKNLQNKLVMEYVKKGDLQGAEDVINAVLAEEEAPLVSGVRQLCAKYEADGAVDKLLALKERLDTETNSMYPIGKSILGAYLVRGEMGDALSYIEKEIQENPDRSRRIGMRSFISKAIQRNLPLDDVYTLIDKVTAQGTEGPAWQLLYAQLDNEKVDQAKMVVERYPAIKEKSTGLIGYIIELMGRDDQVGDKIERVLDMTEGQDYLDREKIYFYLLKNCDNKNDYEGGLAVKQRMEGEDLPVSEFMLKRLALLLRRHGQEVPFDEPPNSIGFYREKLRVEMKDNLPEIGIEEDES